MCDNEDTELDKFYVFRNLFNNESWGAKVIGSETLSSLPNIDFGMKVFARNEKEAIAKAKLIYDRIHAMDGDKENIRRFFAARLQTFDIERDLVTKALKDAIEANKQFNDYLKEIEGEKNG